MHIQAGGEVDMRLVSLVTDHLAQDPVMLGGTVTTTTTAAGAIIAMALVITKISVNRATNRPRIITVATPNIADHHLYLNKHQ